MSEIKAALSAEEWASKGVLGGPGSHRTMRLHSWKGNETLYVEDVPVVLPESRHALAALALHGQPFGFTAEHVRLVRKAAEHVGCNCGEDECWTDDAGARGAFVALADRIAALLPPEGT